MKIGVIADDFTGATDIASFFVENGLSVIQFNGTPQSAKPCDVDVVVISLKSRSVPSHEAIALSLDAAKWLLKQGCQQIYFKYCSTFDSTKFGNIGPVTDALLKLLGETTTVISPGLPINGRTIYKGHLFVLNQLLADSPMKDHPITPMTESNLLKLMELQSKGKAGLIDVDEINKGAEFVRNKIQALSDDNINYVVLDTLNEAHLMIQGEAVIQMKLVTGGSGLAIGLARALKKDKNLAANTQGYPIKGQAVVLSGSCSAMTNRQVQAYQKIAPSLKIDVTKTLDNKIRNAYAEEIVQWIEENQTSQWAPLIFATSDPDSLKNIQNLYGVDASSKAVEALFCAIVQLLKAMDIKKFIVAGGETSGVVAQTLGVEGFYIGPAISPGVPWVKSIDAPISLALKSGNFGDEDFFKRAQEVFPV